MSFLVQMFHCNYIVTTLCLLRNNYGELLKKAVPKRIDTA